VTTLIVAAAVIEQEADQAGEPVAHFLVTRRPPGVHLAGQWEFPGGKCELGESLEECLAREIREELAVDIQIGQEIVTTVHDYPDRRVELHFFRCELRGDPVPQQGQDMRWVAQHVLATLPFPPADEAVIRLLAG
jgi:8-oxo-dGTP diphosphatase